MIAKTVRDRTVLSKNDNFLYETQYNYDLNNNVTKYAYVDRNGSSVQQYTYGNDNLLSTHTLPNGKVNTYTYDGLGRLIGTSLDTTNPLSVSYSYKASGRGGSYTTGMIYEEQIGYGTNGYGYRYEYDSAGNITKVTAGTRNSDGTYTFDSSKRIEYRYDSCNQLIEVYDYINSRLYYYTYDSAGNITSYEKYVMASSGVSVGGAVDYKSYVYDDATWKDLLTKYNGQTLTYDAIGNPLNYRDGITMTWQYGRELASLTDSDKTVTYSYDASGMRTGKVVTTTSGSSTTYSYIYENGLLLQMKRGSRILDFSYDANGKPVSLAYRSSATANPSYYYYGLNSRGDVVALYTASGTLSCLYDYDAYGNVLSVKSSTGIDITSETSVAQLNPLRYRSYVYDNESGLYYLQSRYYDPATCRFVNADGQISTNSDLTGFNLFAYCGNNPINRTDPTGEAWWHWAIGAAIVVACAAATVVTCGGFAAAAGAVAAVSCGVAAATTASTIAAGAFIGSATVFGLAVIDAVATSSSVKEFNDKGNWGTVAATAGGALFGGFDGYSMSKTQTPTSTPTNTSRDSNRRTEPANLREQLAMEQVKSNSSAGIHLTKITLNDPRWPSSEGWVKMQQIVPTSQGDINIHYVYNQFLKIYNDFKFKP